MEVTTLKDEANYIIKKVVAAKQVSRGKISLRHENLSHAQGTKKRQVSNVFFGNGAVMC